MEDKICLWCGTDFEWESGMYRFCTPCIEKLDKIEGAYWRVYKVSLNLAKELELELQLAAKK